MKKDIKVRVYKSRVKKKVNEGKIPTLKELSVLKNAGIDTTPFALVAIEKYKEFLGVSKWS